MLELIKVKYDQDIKNQPELQAETGNKRII